MGLYTMQRPLYIGQIAMVSICFSMSLARISTRVYKDSLSLTYPPVKYLSIFDRYDDFECLWVGSLTMLLMLIIGTMSIHLYTKPTLIRTSLLWV